ncbi:MAG: diguanylate cyclase [Mariprofundaceae bacterium]|nr:diguanylate cyclase [Mariprofundaceae bacterium]
MIEDNLKKRILLPLVIVAMIVLGLEYQSLMRLLDRQLSSEMQMTVSSLQEHFNISKDSHLELMASKLEMITLNDALMDALIDGDREQLLTLSLPIFTKLKAVYHITHFYFHDAQRYNILRVHEPTRYGDKIDRFTMEGAAREQRLFHGMELGPLGTFTLRVVLPVFKKERLIGYIELGLEVEDILKFVQQALATDLVVLIDKQYIRKQGWEKGMKMLSRAPNWSQLTSFVVTYQSRPDIPDSLLKEVSSTTSLTIHRNFLLNNKIYWVSAIHLSDVADREVGQLLLIREMTSAIEETRTEFWLLFGTALLLGVVILIFFYAVLGETVKVLKQAKSTLVDEVKSREDMQIAFIEELKIEQQMLRESEERFEKISASAQDAIVFMNDQGGIDYWNNAASHVFGYDQQSIIGRSLQDLLVPESYYQAFVLDFPTLKQTVKGTALGQTTELTALHQDRGEFPVELSLSSVMIKEKWHAIGIFRDITERKQLQKETEQAFHHQQVLDRLLNISLPALTLSDLLMQCLDEILSLHFCTPFKKGAVFLMSDSQQLLLAVQRNLDDVAVHQKAEDISCPRAQAVQTKQLIFLNAFDHMDKRYLGHVASHGEYCLPILFEGVLLGVLNLYVSATHQSHHDERQYLQTVTDTLGLMIERKRGEEKLKQLAHYDALTGLANRVLFYDRMKSALARGKRHSESFAVLYLDLDHFKQINDSLGHDVGDILLQKVAERLLFCVREVDTVARIGGDEFALILTSLKQVEDVNPVSEKIIHALSQVFEINSQQCFIGASIGISLYPEHAQTMDALIKCADTAMYVAKRQRNVFCVFKPKVKQRT